jgi:hypothetical protein
MGEVIVERGEPECSVKNPPSGTDGSSKRYVAGEQVTHKDEQRVTERVKKGDSRSLKTIRKRRGLRDDNTQRKGCRPEGRRYRDDFKINDKGFRAEGPGATFNRKAERISLA